MARNIKIGTKLIALTTLLTIISLIVIGFTVDHFNRKAVREQYLTMLNTVVDLKVKRYAALTNQLEGDIGIVKDILASGQVALSDMEAKQDENLNLTLRTLAKNLVYSNIIICQIDGKIIYQSNPADPLTAAYANPSQLDEELLVRSLDSTYFSPIFKINKDYQMLVSRVVSLGEGRALLVHNVNMDGLSTTLQDTTGLGNTGEIILAKLDNNKVQYLTPTRTGNTAVMQKDFLPGEPRNIALQEAVKGRSGTGNDTDYRGNEVLAAWRYIPRLGWGIVAKIDEKEALAPAAAIRYTVLLSGIALLIFCIVTSIVFSNLLVRPLLALKTATDLLGKGILPNPLRRASRDEIGEMADTVNNLVNGLRQTAGFAREIGQGNYDSEFTPLSKEDTLGLSLLQMRNSIRDAANRDDDQNWIVTGVAEVGDILRSTDSLTELSEKVLAYVVKRIGAIQGAFYVIDDEHKDKRDEQDDKRKHLIEMVASYAYNKKKYLKARFRFAEGLVGQAVAEMDTILRLEIPDDYMTITSGLLGDRKPKCLLVVPLITIVGSEKEAFGVMEFAGFERFSPRNIRFVNEVSEIIARTVFNIKVNENTKRLLQMSRKQSDELQIQQESLRQNAEEMQATQEELRRTNSELEYQIEEVNNAQQRMQVLLENASEVIIIYEKDTSIRYVSPSVEKILGFNAKEMIATGMAARVSEESQEQVAQLFQNALTFPDQKHTMELLYTKKDGESIWLEAVATNLIADKSINGIVANIRDITERRRAEQEARRRGQMQALSENSPDLITRFNPRGKVFYINPVIEAYTGIGKEEFLQKTLSEITLNGGIVEQWEQVLKNVIADNRKVDMEMDFPSLLGDRVMQVNAIPEYDQEQQIESVLVVSHDITDRKLAEIEIQTKSKKITESINYAQRIQSSILPDNHLIQQVFPQSFILYKPRDVVSGDFPWFMRQGDDLFIAAVDCTGHGVPGALISLIGYFLLNNIARDGGEPGVILDELDRDVTHTLRQDREDVSTRDGMDIALCKINFKTKIVQYAGAHRPLYFMQNNTLHEIKGDKSPIGGGQYKNRGNFVTHTLNFSPGDSVYFCSDGFPDQFGGPDNRKFSPKRIRDIITENAGVDMQTMYQIFDKSFDDWMEGYKQIDDVLMIGIRF
jgi:PAS domain S-box-containing protein